MPKAVETGPGSKLGINVEESMFAAFPDADGKEVFMSGHVDLSKMLQMMCCPLCCTFVPYTSKRRHIEYVKECGPCKCPWAVMLDNKKVGRMKAIKCTENGMMFCLCPWLVCDGHIKILAVHGDTDNERFIFGKELFPCWPFVHACVGVCAPFGFLMQGLCGCYNYCNGTEVRTIRQPIFKGPWKRETGGAPEKMGDFVISERFQPVSCCCAIGTPLSYHYEPSCTEGGDVSAADLAALSLPLAIYRGLPTPCRLCQSEAAEFQMPTGVWCVDIGLMTQVEWKSVQESLQHSD